MRHRLLGLRGGLTNVLGIIVLIAASTIGPLAGPSQVKASSYLDGEVAYEGNFAMSANLDGYDEVVDGVCHDWTDHETEIPCYMKGDDDYSQPIDIGFNFDYYGVTYSQLAANTNGVISFDCPNRIFTNTELPTDFETNCPGGDPGIEPIALFPFWDDIITAPKELICQEYSEDDTCIDYTWVDNYPTVVYKTVGTPGSRKFIMQWTNMYLYDSPNIPVGTFQAILYEGSNNIQFQYRNLLGDPERSSGSDATIGIQKNLTTYSEYSAFGNVPIHQGEAIRYTPTGDGDYNAADDTAAYDPVYLRIPGTVEAPTLSRPNDSATNVARRPILTWNATSDATSYVATISTTADFSDIVSQSESTTDTQYMPSHALDPNTLYYWNVKAQNDAGEVFSDTRTFTTGSQIADELEATGTDIDGDHIDDYFEDRGPNNGDANDDGTPDAEQANVVSLPNANHGNDYVTLETDEACSITDVSSQAASSVSDKDVAFGYNAGLLNYVADCGDPGYTTTVSVYQYGAHANDLTLRKYNPTTHSYTSIADATLEDVTIGGRPAVKATYSITDGGELDTDATEDGIITDPVGLASPIIAAPNTGLGRR